MSRFSPASRSTLPAEDWRDADAELVREFGCTGTRRFEFERLDERDGLWCEDGVDFLGEDEWRKGETRDV